MQERNKNIGTLKGRLLVFGGVYSNLQSLEKLKEIANDLKIDASNIICTGDVVGYCAQPEECVQLIINWGIQCIAGNVEIQLKEGREDCGCDFSEGGRCDIFSKRWYPYSHERLSVDSVDWMKQLPEFIQFNYSGKHVTVLHGSLHQTAEYVFLSTPWDIKVKNLSDANSDVILAGHCGLPFHDLRNDKLWVNPGVIGMPANDGTSRVWYMVIDQMESGEIRFDHCSFEYDYEKAATLMEQNQLPSEYAGTLRSGIWDNCEILPPKETALQGAAISLSRVSFK